MENRLNLPIVSLLIVLGLALASCAPAASPTPVPSSANPSPGPSPTVSPKLPAVAPTPVSDVARYGGILAVALQADPPSLDAHRETTLNTIKPIGPQYNNLVQFDPLDQSKVIGDLAQRWEVNSDGTVYTFHLNKEVKWHDGTPFSSEDIRYTFERIRNPPKGLVSPRKDTLSAVDRIETPDANSVRFVLSYPSASFLDNVAVPWHLVLPKHVLEAEGQDALTKKAVGTGPFKFKEYIRGVSYVAAKNPDYFVKGRPYLDGVKFFVIKDHGAQLAALRTGQVHLRTPGTSPASSQIEMAKKTMGEKLAVQWGPGYGYDQIVFNMGKAPWNDPRVRRAVRLAIDVQASIQVTMEGQGDPGAYMVPEGRWALPQAELLKLPGYRQPKDQDIAEAKKLLAEAGFPSGFKTSIMARIEYEKFAVFVADELRKVGIEAKIDMREVGAYHATMNARGFEIASAKYGRVLDDPDYTYGADLLTGAGRNYSNFSDARFDELFRKQSRMLDAAERRKTVLEMERLLLELNPRVSVLWERGVNLALQQVKSYKIGAGNHFNNMYQDVWLAQ